jgi:TRAP-type C4-dicarboxylate transport system permease small subunit
VTADLPVRGRADGAQPVAEASSLARFLFVRIPYWIAGALLLVAIAINMANVIGRYVFAAPVFWAEEVLIFMIIWGVYVAAGSISYLGAHLTMDLFSARLRSPYRRFLGILTVILTVTCSAFVVMQTARILGLYLRTGEATMAARVPLVYAHAAVLVGFALMGIVTFIRVRPYTRDAFD